MWVNDLPPSSHPRGQKIFRWFGSGSNLPVSTRLRDERLSALRASSRQPASSL
jgi:hypothetical protein